MPHKKKHENLKRNVTHFSTNYLLLGETPVGSTKLYGPHSLFSQSHSIFGDELHS